jgi:large subunit ribosomal protein L21
MTEATVAKKKPKASPKPLAPRTSPEGLYAVFTTGGKQYRVRAGDMLKIEKLAGEHKVGDTLTFDQVLMTDNGGSEVTMGAPFISGSAVTATITKIDRLAKVIVIKYKQKSRYFKKNGHRQPYFQVRIDKVA